jgi:argininosuccinate lyase
MAAEKGIYRARVSKGLGEKVWRFVSSLKEDERMVEEDLCGTEAHEIMLYEQGILSREELRSILSSLERMREEYRKGKLRMEGRFEDVHEFLESRVIAEVGMETGGKLHTGRSRNDQVALDLRLRLRKDLNELSSTLLELVGVLLRKAEENLETPLVLLTHTQHAQVGTLGHYFLAQADLLLRDFDRMEDCYHRVNLCPLGGGAVGGSSFPLDRKRTASLLGFEGLVENSLDAVSSRDAVVEAVACLSLIMCHLSRMAEDLILWSTQEFGYVELSDEYSSTSSAMPQKKNPCTLELIRGKTGEVYGALLSLLTLLKGIPTGYNRDLQQVKPPLWRGVEETRNSLEIMKGVVETLRIKGDRLSSSSSLSWALAWDLAEGLVRETGLSFREAHAVVGRAVGEALTSGLTVKDLSVERLERAAEEELGRRVKVNGRILRYLDPLSSLKQRRTLGSPSPREVRRMLGLRRGELEKRRSRLESRRRREEKALRELEKTVKAYMSR